MICASVNGFYQNLEEVQGLRPLVILCWRRSEMNEIVESHLPLVSSLCHGSLEYSSARPQIMFMRQEVWVQFQQGFSGTCKIPTTDRIKFVNDLRVGDQLLADNSSSVTVSRIDRLEVSGSLLMPVFSKSGSHEGWLLPDQLVTLKHWALLPLIGNSVVGIPARLIRSLGDSSKISEEKVDIFSVSTATVCSICIGDVSVTLVPENALSSSEVISVFAGHSQNGLLAHCNEAIPIAGQKVSDILRYCSRVNPRQI
jgi:hypothetical protein